ncbi:MAG TPA: hypothetical protein VMU66_00360 [Gaiellales bacterium]|nr:hypothetical protein [Gaiellales bacterium]
MGEDRERVRSAADEPGRYAAPDEGPDVEAHRHRLQSEDQPKQPEDASDDDTPDVDAHMHRR